MKNTKFNIKEYSAFAACILLLQRNVDAEAVYGDVIPDSLVNEEWETFTLDLNDDGVSDFRFLNRSFSFMPSSSSTSHLNILFVGPLVFGNLIAGNPHVVFPSYGGFTVYFPYALTVGATIDQDSLDFQNPGDQTLAYRYKGENSTYFPNGGHWFPEVFDHYLGLYFKDTTDCYHYGWVRLDVKDFGRQLVIKDYAYETKCDVGILAGDTIGDTTTVGVDHVNSLDVVVYSFGNSVFVKLNAALNNAEMHVYNLEGKEIYQSASQNQFTEIKLDTPKGIYLVEIITDEDKLTKKVFLN